MATLRIVAVGDREHASKLRLIPGRIFGNSWQGAEKAEQIRLSRKAIDLLLAISQPVQK